MKTQKRVLAALLCAAMLLLGGCAGQTDDTQSPVVFQEEETSSAVSRTESALEASATVQPASPEVSQPEESSGAESSASEEETSSVPETAAPEVAAALTTTTPQAAPSTQTTACQHSFHDEGFDSTCSELGQHIYVCTKCGYIEYGENIPMKHDGKYVCEYCGIPMPEFPFEGLNTWLKTNYNGVWQHTDSLGTCVVNADPYEDDDITVFYDSADGQLSLYFSFDKSGSTIIEFFGDEQTFCHLKGVWNSSEISRDFPRLESLGYEDPQMQQALETELYEALDRFFTVFQQLLDPFGLNIAMYGFTSW